MKKPGNTVETVILSESSEITNTNTDDQKAVSGKFEVFLSMTEDCSFRYAEKNLDERTSINSAY
jgi:hypothetical protein